MVDYPTLPGLLPGDPQNRLSTEARKHIGRARLESERIRWKALALIDAKGLDRKGREARYRTNRANLKAARVVLRVFHEEYGKLEIPIREFREFMRQEIEAAANSLELFSSQKHMLEVEFFEPKEIRRESEDASAQHRPRATPAPVVRSRGTITSPAAARRMDAYMAANALGQTEFAILAGTTDRTLRSFRKTGTARKDIFDQIAKAMGTNRADLLRPDGQSGK